MGNQDWNIVKVSQKEYDKLSKAVEAMNAKGYVFHKKEWTLPRDIPPVTTNDVSFVVRMPGPPIIGRVPMHENS